jgi:phosphoglycolate phosphatase
LDVSFVVKGILFDKDGVLFDFQATWGGWADRMIEALSEDDQALAQRLADVLDFDRPTAKFRPGSLAIAGTAAETAAVIAKELPGRDADDLYSFLNKEAAKTPAIEAVPLFATLDALRARGLRLGVATNDTESAARAQLRSVDAEGCFDFIAGSDSGYGAKPAPGMCTAFAESMDLAPRDLVMVGDSTHDIDAGRAAGFTCVAVLTGVATRADLTPHADAVLTDIAELAAWLDQTTR